MSNYAPNRPRMSPVSSRRSFAIVASQYNPDCVKGLVDAARRELLALAPQSSVEMHEVPGAFEIPVIVQEVAHKGTFDAIIALGVIIEGQTFHADLIGRAITNALMDISLRFRTPVIHEVLLVHNEEQARARTLHEEHNRGVEAARAAVRMVAAMAELKR